MSDLPSFLKDMNAVLKDENCNWLHGHPPDYSKVNNLYLTERSKVHAEGSLEEQLNNLFKNWERELSHKTDPTQWRTISIEDGFRMNVNGTGWLSLEEVAKMGAYNAFVGDTEYYCASRVLDPHLSHQIFRTALNSGFGWECVEVYSPPPKIVFKWRHWGKVDGELKCPMRNGKDISIAPIGNEVEIFGISIVRVNEKFQMLEVENYFRPGSLMEQMVKNAIL